mmetsp:Transcript_5291/g.10481  ORF Transcript_5291/g.10481 Transcript_5291/m.10481 type:complete len:97 (+) Transcript_5291:1314-1604(+)
MEGRKGQRGDLGTEREGTEGVPIACRTGLMGASFFLSPFLIPPRFRFLVSLRPPPSIETTRQGEKTDQKDVNRWEQEREEGIEFWPLSVPVSGWQE